MTLCKVAQVVRKGLKRVIGVKAVIFTKGGLTESCATLYFYLPTGLNTEFLESVTFLF